MAKYHLKCTGIQPLRTAAMTVTQCQCHGLSLQAGQVYQRAVLRMRDLLTGEVGKRGPPNVGSDYQAG